MTQKDRNVLIVFGPRSKLAPIDGMKRLGTEEHWITSILPELLKAYLGCQVLITKTTKANCYKHLRKEERLGYFFVPACHADDCHDQLAKNQPQATLVIVLDRKFQADVEKSFWIGPVLYLFTFTDFVELSKLLDCAEERCRAAG